MTGAIPVILNAASGPDGDAKVEQARRAFATQQLAVDLIACSGGEGLAAALRRGLDPTPALLVAGGGDGTLATVAAQLVDRDIAFGVLPLGTRNHFAKDLGIPLPLAQATRVIADGQRSAVDVGELRGGDGQVRVFLNNSSLGLYPRIVSAREQAQRRLHLGKWPALLRATWHALRDPHTFTVRLEVDGARLQRRTPFVFVGNNRYQLQGFGAGSRPRLDEGVLSVFVLRPQTLTGFLRLAVRALLGRVSAAEDFEAFAAAQLQVESARTTVEVALDGEVTQVATPLQFRVRPRALQVLVPRGDNNGAGAG
jgi:diacylglycerol kinase family enzyme